jgi:hypothetical protein
VNIRDEIIEDIGKHYDTFKRWPTHISFGVECIKAWPRDDYEFPRLGGTFMGLKVILSPAHGNSFSVGRM